MPFGVAALMLERWLARQWLRVRRKRGEFCARVLLVGSIESAREVAANLSAVPHVGLRVVGACVPGGRIGRFIEGTNVVIAGDLGQVEDVVARRDADTVVITSSEHIGTRPVKEISWSLTPGEQHLILAPSIIDFAGPRTHSRPVAGRLLLHVETPRPTLLQRMSRRELDLGPKGA